MINGIGLADADRAHVMHPCTPLRDYATGASKATVIAKASGVYVYDLDGNQFLDGLSGLYCVHVGYGRKEIADAIYSQGEKVAYYHTHAGHTNEPTIHLSQKLCSMARMGPARVCYGLSGSDANETAIQIAWQYNTLLGRPRKKKIVACRQSCHGTSMVAGLAGRPVFDSASDHLSAPFLHTVTPHFYRFASPHMSEESFAQHCAAELEATIVREGPDTVAAFITEPVLTMGGVITPPKGYWREIRAVLEKYDVLLILDEVVSGFGRLGTAFGSDMFEIEPDLMTVAKGLTSGYLPLSALLIGGKVWRVLEDASRPGSQFYRGNTYSAHPLCAAAALANLGILENENLVENARMVGAYLQKRLRDEFGMHPMVGEVRGAGLLAGVEFVADKENKRPFRADRRVAQQIAAACRQRGLIARALPYGDVLGFAPPLVVSVEEIDLLVDRFKGAVSEVASGMGYLE